MYNDGLIVYMLSTTTPRYGSFYTHSTFTRGSFIYKAEFTVNGKTYYCNTTMPSYEIEYYTSADSRKKSTNYALDMFNGSYPGYVSTNGDIGYTSGNVELQVYLAILI